jgi:hypothetical protein
LTMCNWSLASPARLLFVIEFDVWLTRTVNRSSQKCDRCGGRAPTRPCAASCQSVRANGTRARRRLPPHPHTGGAHPEPVARSKSRRDR